MTTWRPSTEPDGGQSPVADPYEAITGGDRRASRTLWSAPVAVVCGTRLADKIAHLGPVLGLQPRIDEDQLRAHGPARLVVEEEFIFASPWRRWVDDQGEAWGPLRSLAESFDSSRLPVYVFSNHARGERLTLVKAQYLPNLRTKQLQADLEFLDPLLALLQRFVPAPVEGAP